MKIRTDERDKIMYAILLGTMALTIVAILSESILIGAGKGDWGTLGVQIIMLAAQLVVRRRALSTM